VKPDKITAIFAGKKLNHLRCKNNGFSVFGGGMKIRILLGSSLFAFAVLILVVTTSCQAGGDNRLVTVMNPAMSPDLVERVSLTPRLDTLEGKTIYLYDTLWGGPEANLSVYEEMRDWFSRNIPSVNIVIHQGPGWMADDQEILKIIDEKKVDGILIGISG
jgi:hypothetical protein